MSHNSWMKVRRKELEEVSRRCLGRKAEQKDLQERVVLMGIHSYHLPVEDSQHHRKLERLGETHKNLKQD